MSKFSTKSISDNIDLDNEELKKGVFFGKTTDSNRGKGLWALVEIILAFFGLISK